MRTMAMTRAALVVLALALAASLAPPAHADETDGAATGPGLPGDGSGLLGAVPGYSFGAGGLPFALLGPEGLGTPLRDVLRQLPEEKRAALRTLDFATRREMIAKAAAVAQARLDLAEIMQTYPLDRAAALDAMRKLSAAERAAFEVRLNALAQVQQLLGRELWERTRFGPQHRPGDGPPPRHRPGSGPPPWYRAGQAPDGHR